MRFRLTLTTFMGWPALTTIEMEGYKPIPSSFQVLAIYKSKLQAKRAYCDAVSRLQGAWWRYLGWAPGLDGSDAVEFESNSGAISAIFSKLRKSND